MATRSTISVELENHNIRTVYCHWDGYPSHNGRLLFKHYNSQELAELVTSLGDISSLAAEFHAPEGHTFDTPIPGYTVLYGRDRHEPDCDARVYRDFADYLQNSQQEEYNYIWRDGQWLLDDNDEFISLKEILETNA